MDVIALMALCAEINRNCEVVDPYEFDAETAVIEAASEYDIPADLALAVAKQESRFKCDALSSVGAVGVMQVMPATAKWLGYDPDKLTNCYYGAKVGMKYLRMQLDATGWNLTKALVSYNCGPSCRNPNNKETVNYVRKIKTTWEN